jgi:hypothetical protein
VASWEQDTTALPSINTVHAPQEPSGAQPSLTDVMPQQLEHGHVRPDVDTDRRPIQREVNVHQAAVRLLLDLWHDPHPVLPRKRRLRLATNGAACFSGPPE